MGKLQQNKKKAVVTDKVVVRNLLEYELDYGITMGRQPVDDPDRTERKRPKGRDDPLTVLVEQAIAIRNAKIIRMQLMRASIRDYNVLEDIVHPLWPVVWWDDACISFHPSDLGFDWNADDGDQRLEILYF